MNMPNNPNWRANLTRAGKGRPKKNRIKKLISLSPKSVQWLKSFPNQSEKIEELIMNEIKSGLSKAFEAFLQSEFNDAVDRSTEASWGGSGYSVELFPDGHYRILWNNQIGNLYQPLGMIIGIPSLTDEEWDDDPSLRYYDIAEEYMQEVFAEKLEMLSYN